jgi:hypothetical protein
VAAAGSFGGRGAFCGDCDDLAPALGLDMIVGAGVGAEEAFFDEAAACAGGALLAF